MMYATKPTSDAAASLRAVRGRRVGSGGGVCAWRRRRPRLMDVYGLCITTQPHGVPSFCSAHASLAAGPVPTLQPYSTTRDAGMPSVRCARGRGVAAHAGGGGYAGAAGRRVQAGAAP